ncbi:LPS-assembly protein LptD [Candidatus Sumerlaeota bacterium]|nr:LPS-assembly protein LptD [Candidatus Sumerlaeota bacterium]
MGLVLVAIIALVGVTPVLGADDPATSPTKEIVFPSSEGEGGKGAVRIETTEGYLHYDEENDLIHASRRARVTYEGLVLEADSMVLDVRLKEIQAAGNVRMVGNGADVSAEKMRYDLGAKEGEAYKAYGSYGEGRTLQEGGTVYFRYGEKEKPGEPTFRQLTEYESVMHGASLSSCDFTVPHYRISAREILLYPNDRVFMKGATLYIREIPVFYFPVYSKSLRESSPWMVRVGYKSSLGPYARVGYVFQHEKKEPSLESDKKFVTKSRGEAQIFADFLAKRGFGAGATYKYFFNEGAHEGQTEVYYLNDTDREVDEETEYSVQEWTRDPATGDVIPIYEWADGTLHRDREFPGQEPYKRKKKYEGKENDTGRYQIVVKHRSAITGHTRWIVNADWVSDPDLYYEVLDLFRDEARKRVMERRARTALTWAREQFVARLLFEVKDRIGRDRITDFSDPSDNDRDYDEQPELDIEDREERGIPMRRWGRATIRAPQIELSTAWLKLWGLPVYYHTDLNIFNNLDKGLNTVDQDDDAFVRGFDWYHALMWRWRLAERYTLLAKLGAGGGFASREQTDFNYFQGEDHLYPLILDNAEGGSFNRAEDAGLEFIDPETFKIGEEEYKLSDVSSGYGYADLMLRLNARFTDALTGDAIYRYRFATRDSLGDWYSQIGDKYVRSDLYNFRLREHNIEGVLRYQLAVPRLSVALRLFRNLVSNGDLYPQELISSYGLYGSWINAAETLNVSSGVSLDGRQIFHPSDKRAYVDSGLNYRVSAGYRPRSGLWWTRVGARYRQGLDKALGDSDRDRFSEDDDRLTVSALLGGKIGPKWSGELETEWDSRASTLKTIGLTLNRDLHDALLMMLIRMEQDIYDNEDNGNNGSSSFLDQMDFRVAVQPKLPKDRLPRGVPGITTLEDRVKTPAIGEAEAGAQEVSFQRY